VTLLPGGRIHGLVAAPWAVGEKKRYVKFLKTFLMLLVPLLLLASFAVLATGVAPYKVYVIHTGSMSPNIPSGSAVLVHEGHYRVGQVITFTEGGLTVTHRLVAINKEGLVTTKGDANPTNDPWHFPKSQIIGGVVVAPRYVGYWITYFRNPLGLVSVLLAAVALWQIWTLGDASEAESSPASRPSRRWMTPARRSRAAAQLAEQRRAHFAELFGVPANSNWDKRAGAK